MLYDNQQKYQAMKIKLLLLAISLFALFCNATDDSNGSGKKRIDLSDSSPTFPHMIDVAEPVAMYTISTATVDITFDATYYSEYTVHLVGEYTEQDIFVNSQVVYIPVATFGDIVDIYIESDDCGSYYGVLDQSAYTNT